MSKLEIEECVECPKTGCWERTIDCNYCEDVGEPFYDDGGDVNCMHDENKNLLEKANGGEE
jgi:predicted NBD/HSP70 family sugar kinase